MRYNMKNKSSSKLVSDESWRAAHGGVVSTFIYNGETVDFNRISNNWNKLGCDPCDWAYAVNAYAPTDNLRENTAPPVRIIETILPIGVKKFSVTEFVYDFGVNVSALPKITVNDRKGDTVQLFFAEFANEYGTLDPASEIRALNTDVYSLNRRRSPFIKFNPYCPDGLDYVSALYETIEGKIETCWHREDEKLVFELAIPDGASADVTLVNGSNKKSMVLGAGKYSYIL